MLAHYLRLIFRGFKRSKTVFLINLLGLSTGLAAALLIWLWVSDEWNVDKFYPNEARLYQVMVNRQQENRIHTEEGTGGILGEALKAEVPEVEAAVSTTPDMWFQRFNVSYHNNTIGAKGNFAGREFFHVFPYQLLQGHRDQVLHDRNSIVLSAGMAKKIFNTTDNIVGKVIQWKWLSIQKQCVVTGVFADMPSNATQQYDFVLPLDAWKDIAPATNDITMGPFKTYVVLRPGTAIDAFNQKIANFVNDKVKGANAGIFLRKYADAYLHGKYENGKPAGGRIEYVRFFILIAIFILAIACINFMNLSTARASRRMKEIGLKKALGARAHLLVLQFLGESLLMSFISLFIAIALIILLLPWFNQLTGKHIALGLDLRIIASVLVITFLTGLVAGSYPAFYLSRFKPAVTLKGKFTASLRSLWVRKGAVVFQFVISVVFVCAMLVVYNQVKYVQNKDLGFNKDNVIYFELDGTTIARRDAFLAALKDVPGVVSASSIQQKVILPSGVPYGVMQWDGKNQDGQLRFYEMPVNYGLIETLGIQMQSGRPFSRQFGTDTTGIIVNAAAVKAMNLSEDPVGKTVNLDGQNVHIVGVTKNFHFNSLHDEIKPFIFKLSPDETMLAMVRIQAAASGETIRRIGQFYSNFNPGYTFDYRFLDGAYQAQYAADQLVASLSKYFAGLAILISCLGLFGLAAFTAERRTREIGVRKVLGASETNIVYLLSIDFTKIILVAICIALPLAYFITRHWLDSFAYRISLSPLYFLAASGVALFIAWFTIGLQTVKAARVSPLLSLRDE